MQPEINQISNGADLASLRRAAILTQAELATAADVGLSTVHLAESGKIASPQPRTVRALASALGATPQAVAAAIAESRRRAVEVSHGA